MGDFVAEANLSEAIREVCKGKDIKIACAFWGLGAARALGLKGKKNAQIICDVSMGGTNPKELRELGAPDNPNLKVMPGLHAKVYLSSRGGVVCSANASNNGVGFLDNGGALTEAGIRVAHASPEWKSAEKWFVGTFRSSKQVSDCELTLAEDFWSRRRQGDGMLPLCESEDIFDCALTNPSLWTGWGFVFTQWPSRAERLSIANEIGGRVEGQDFFVDWSEADIARWPLHFVNVHRDENGIGIYLNKTLERGRDLPGPLRNVTVTRLRDVPKTVRDATIQDRTLTIKRVLAGLDDGRPILFPTVDDLQKHLRGLE